MEKTTAGTTVMNRIVIIIQQPLHHSSVLQTSSSVQLASVS